MRVVFVVFAIALLAFAASPAATAEATADCAIPCPPGVAVISFDFDQRNNLRFDSNQTIDVAGTVTYAINVTQYGWFFDPTDEPRITFQVAEGPWWVDATVEPAVVVVPVHDPQYLDADGWYRYTTPIDVPFRLEGTPSAGDLAAALVDEADPEYRLLLAATSEATMVDGGPAGHVGTMAGYGVADFRFQPEADWHVSNTSDTQPARLEGHATPGPGAWALILALAAAATSINTNSKKPL